MAEEVLSSFCMRATITVDGELAQRLGRLSQERATSFEESLDDASGVLASVEEEGP